MTSRLKPNTFRPKDFREDDALLLFGYVHEFESNFDDEFFVPKAIIEMIIAYYSWVDSWDIRFDDYFDINVLTKTIQRRDAYNMNIYSAFGENIIDTITSGANTQYVWNFKITQKGTNGRQLTETIVGLIDTKYTDNDQDEQMSDRGWSDFTSYGGYGFNSRNGELLHVHSAGKAYQPRGCREDDIICMLLTIGDVAMNGNNTIKFFINGVDQGYAFTSIPGGTYKLAISMAQPDQIKLF